MLITPSDQPSNSDLSYRAGRWIAVAIVRLAERFRKLALGKTNMRCCVLGNRQQAGKEIEMTIQILPCQSNFARLVPPI